MLPVGAKIWIQLVESSYLAKVQTCSSNCFPQLVPRSVLVYVLVKSPKKHCTALGTLNGFQALSIISSLRCLA